MPELARRFPMAGPRAISRRLETVCRIAGTGVHWANAVSSDPRASDRKAEGRDGEGPSVCSETLDRVRNDVASITDLGARVVFKLFLDIRKKYK